MADEKPEARAAFPKWVFGLIGCLVLLPICGVVALVAAVILPSNEAFYCRTQQTEAKSMLKALQASEKMHFLEQGEFSADLVTIDLRPQAGARYLIGFAHGERSTTADPEVLANAGLGASVARKQNGDPLTAADLPPETRATADTFLAAAVGNVDLDATLDVWTVDEHGSLVSLTNDCAD